MTSPSINKIRLLRSENTHLDMAEMDCNIRQLSLSL